MSCMISLVQHSAAFNNRIIRVSLCYRCSAVYSDRWNKTSSSNKTWTWLAGFCHSWNHPENKRIRGNPKIKCIFAVMSFIYLPSLIAWNYSVQLYVIEAQIIENLDSKIKDKFYRLVIGSSFYICRQYLFLLTVRRLKTVKNSLL